MDTNSTALSSIIISYLNVLLLCMIYNAYSHTSISHGTRKQGEVYRSSGSSGRTHKNQSNFASRSHREWPSNSTCSQRFPLHACNVHDNRNLPWATMIMWLRITSASRERLLRLEEKQVEIAMQLLLLLPLAISLSKLFNF